MTFAILTDSTADLDQNWAKEHQVTILGLTIELEGTVYQTVGQDQLTSPELLEAMKNGAKPTTSQVNVGQFQETFKQFAKEGKDLLYVAFSSVLSGTYQSAVMARDLVLEDYPEAVIEIVDQNGGFNWVQSRISTKSKRSLLWKIAFIHKVVAGLQVLFSFTKS